MKENKQTQNLYNVLGIQKNANHDEIKKAYRNLALKYHPDRNLNNPSSEAKFRQVTKAYETLGDSDSRQKYDKSLRSYTYIDDTVNQTWTPRPEPTRSRDRPNFFDKQPGSVTAEYSFQITEKHLAFLGVTVCTYLGHALAIRKGFDSAVFNLINPDFIMNTYREIQTSKPELANSLTGILGAGTFLVASTIALSAVMYGEELYDYLDSKL
ncbi:J domain-containing protein [archaeon]|jgi:curved DNA-binding protein CbpA|nr:J domain-containing protein [archaeon]